MDKADKSKIIAAIRQLGGSVTVADVSAGTGLPLHTVSSQLNHIAAETCGSLDVATTGDILYRFPYGFEGLYLLKGVRYLLLKLMRFTFRAALLLFKISFGAVLMASLIFAWLVLAPFVFVSTMISLASSSGSTNVEEGSDEGSFASLRFLDPGVLFRLFSGRSDDFGELAPETNLLIDCFAFLFGSGIPNAQLEQRKWKLIAATIKKHDGVVTAYELAPYTGKAAHRDEGVFPVLARFHGRPVVTQSGQIVYIFPELQMTAQSGDSWWMDDDLVDGGAPWASHHSDPYLEENYWQFVDLPGNSVTRVLVLAMTNLIVTWALWMLIGFLGRTTITHTVVTLLAAYQNLILLATIFALYSALFLIVPCLRFVVTTMLNLLILRRNNLRRGCADRLASPTAELSAKLAEAAQYEIPVEHIYDKRIVFTTDRDALEQEFDDPH